MSEQHVEKSEQELGIFSLGMPVVWLTAAVLGFGLIANWPELFAASAQAGPASATDAAAAFVSSDPPVPEASKVFAGHLYETTEQFDTF